MPPVFSRETTRVSVQDASHAGQGRTSPCECRCPAGNPIQKMERAIADGNEALALEYLRARNPFPGVTGRVCPHPCETGCNRNSYDEGVAIRALERHAADYGSAFRRMKPLPSTGKRIAVIGSGPAGLTCAYFSALLGHTVDVFEASPVAGGVPRQAIPDFRLPKAVVDREVGLVLGLGVNILTNTAVGRDISLASLLERYDACLIAAGNGKERRLNIPGIEHALPAVRFLRESNLNRTRLDGKRVAILGGGGVAFDCAFTVKRLGAAETHLVFLEDMGHVRVPAEEIRQAEDEGIRLHPSHLASAVRCGNGTVSGVTADAVSGFRFDERGNLSVDRIPGSVLELEADIVICASGLTAALDFLDAVPGVERTPRGFIAAAPETGMTSKPGLYAAGECASGPSLVCAAIGEGRRTALAMHTFLTGTDAAPLEAWFDDEGLLALHPLAGGTEQHVVAFEEIVNIGYHEKAPRNPTERLAARETWLAFEELDKGLTLEAARAEAARCLHCGHCQSCWQCVASCPGLILKEGEHGPEVAYPDECWHCGCCRLACPGACISFRFPLHTFL